MRAVGSLRASLAVKNDKEGKKISSLRCCFDRYMLSADNIPKDS